MEIKGMKGLHEICKENAAGLSMPDEVGVGEDIKVILSVDPSTTKKELREFFTNDIQGSLFTGEAKIIAHRDLA